MSSAENQNPILITHGPHTYKKSTQSVVLLLIYLINKFGVSAYAFGQDGI
jgi:hypothetical protein